MKISLKETSFQIFLKIVLLIFAGYIFINPAVIRISDDAFTYSIYGVSLILFFHAIKTFGFKDFVLPAAIYAVIVIMSLMNLSLLTSFFKNILLFILLGVIAFYGLKTDKKFTGSAKLVFLFAYWLLGGVVFYLINSVFNIYVFGLDILGMNETFLTYMLVQLKTGVVLGGSIGLGMIIPTDKIINIGTKVF